MVGSGGGVGNHSWKQGKLFLAPAKTGAAGSDSTILNMAANCAGSASQI